MKIMDHLKYALAICIAGASFGSVAYADDYDDDIYYNPSKAKKQKTSANAKPKAVAKSAYIADYQDMDVDEYNRRGQYYPSPVDTIGNGAENGEDFVYTQQIQKFYNPKIVVNNAAQLEDIIANSYGNVDVIFDFSGVPAFTSWYGSPAYGWPSSYPYYAGYWNNPYSWYNWWGGVYVPYWGWSPSWNYGPSWVWGPAWSWGSSWGWGPSWSWGWNYPVHWHPHYAYSSYRSYGNRAVGPRKGWAASTRKPGSNYAGGGVVNGGGHRYSGGQSSSGAHSGTSSRPGVSSSASDRRQPVSSGTLRGNRGNAQQSVSTNSLQTNSQRPVGNLQTGTTSSSSGRYTVGGHQNSSKTNGSSQSNVNNSGRGTRNSYNTGSNGNSNRSTTGSRYGTSGSGSSSRSSGSRSSGGGARSAGGGRGGRR